MNDGSQRLLGILEAFGVSLLESLEAQSTSIIRTNIGEYELIILIYFMFIIICSCQCYVN